jgi:hypothetical protein
MSPKHWFLNEIFCLKAFFHQLDLSFEAEFTGKIVFLGGAALGF